MAGSAASEIENLAGVSRDMHGSTLKQGTAIACAKHEDGMEVDASPAYVSADKAAILQGSSHSGRGRDRGAGEARRTGRSKAGTNGVGKAVEKGKAGSNRPGQINPVIEDPHQVTRQTIKNKSDVDRIFEDQCLFVSPLYAAAEEDQLGKSSQQPMSRGCTRGGDRAGSGNCVEDQDSSPGLYGALPDSAIIVHTTEHVDAALEEIRPSFVVVLSPDMEVTRLLEVYKSHKSVATLRVYYLSYSESVEEQRYLSEVRRETVRAHIHEGLTFMT